MSTSVWDLAEGDRVRIVRDFEDFNRQRILAGRELVLSGKEYFPHDCGHTLAFEGNVVIRLSGDVPAQLAVIENADDAYFVRVGS
jgi:hypothetical protein